MVRVLRIISIVALLAAGLVWSLDIIRICQGDRWPEVLGGPSIGERFRLSSAGRPGDGRFPSSPLIEQAQRFAAYLNPPKTLAPSTATAHAKDAPHGPTETVTTSTVTAALVPAPASPAAFSLPFTLQGISYYRQDPEQSMALVYEPGAGRRWVRLGAQMGHFIIERIEADTITCREGTRMHLMALAHDETPAKSPGINEEASSPKPMAEPMPAAPAPPPVRGLRQMPLARVTAKTGLPASLIQLPDVGSGQSQ